MAQENQSQVQEFLDILRKRRWLVVLPALFVTTLGIGFAVVVPKKYEIDTVLEIRESRIESDYRLRDPNENATKIELQNAEQHIKNHRRIQEILEENPEAWPEYDQAVDRLERTAIVTRIKANLSVDVAEKKRDRGSTFITVVYTDVDAQRGEEFLSVLTTRWVNEVFDRDRQALDKEREILQENQADTQKELNRVNQDYFDLANHMRVDPFQYLDGGKGFGSGGADPRYTNYLQTLADIEDVSEELAERQARRDDLARALEDEPELLPLRVPVPGEDNSRERLRREVRLEEIRELQAGMTPRNSQYQLLDAEAERLKKELLELDALHTDPSVIEELGPNPARVRLLGEIRGLELEISGLQGRLRELNENAKRSESEIDRHNADKQDLDHLRDRKVWLERELAEIDAQLAQKRRALQIMDEAQGRPYEITKPPGSTAEPVEPNPLLIVTIAVLGGLALGLFLAIAAEFLPNCYRTTGEVARLLGVPVLGTVDLIVTRAQRRRALLRSAFVGGCSGVILLVLGWFIWTVAYSRETLPSEVRQAIEDLQLMLM